MVIFLTQPPYRYHNSAQFNKLFVYILQLISRHIWKDLKTKLFTFSELRSSNALCIEWIYMYLIFLGGWCVQPSSYNMHILIMHRVMHGTQYVLTHIHLHIYTYMIISWFHPNWDKGCARSALLDDAVVLGRTILRVYSKCMCRVAYIHLYMSMCIFNVF